MTNLQLCLSIGIPGLLIVLNWMQTNYRFSDLKENMNQRFSQVEARLTRLETGYREFYSMRRS